MSDGGLRQIFQMRLPAFDWQSVETWSTGRGVPDLNYCHNGCEGWIECKATSTDKVDIRPEQIAWAERRARHGGRVFMAVRKARPRSPRLEACDDLYLIHNVTIWREVKRDGLKSDFIYWAGGPASWAWTAIAATLSKTI